MSLLAATNAATGFHPPDRYAVPPDRNSDQKKFLEA